MTLDHVSLAVSDVASSRAFYVAPGWRPQYHANYYGAFVFDPDGNNAEAVCHFAED